MEFLVPEVLKDYNLPPRFYGATFDRELAIRRNDAEFLALGHQFVDAMLAYVGSYDFGGLTACRCIKAPAFQGRCGFLFLFVVRQRLTREDGDECLFHFEPVFVDSGGKVDEQATVVAVTQEAGDADLKTAPGDAEAAFNVAKKFLENKAQLWDWQDDVEFLGTSWVEFEG